jgi:hypothetical protein
LLRWRHIDEGECCLVSQSGNVFKSFPALNEVILRNSAPGRRCDLLFRRGEPRLYATRAETKETLDDYGKKVGS